MGWRLALAVTAVVLAGCTASRGPPVGSVVVEETVDVPGLEAAIVDVPDVLGPVQPFIEHRIQRFPDPMEPALRGTYDGETGEYDPSDVG